MQSIRNSEELTNELNELLFSLQGADQPIKEITKRAKNMGVKKRAADTLKHR